MKHPGRFVLILCLLALAMPAGAQTITLQIGAAVPANSPWDLGLRKIAAEWSRISGGAVRLNFPKSMANASQEDIIQKMKFSLDGALLETAGLSFIDKNIMLLSMPSVVHDEREFAAAVSAAEPLLRKSIGERYEIITVAQGGWIRFFSNKALVVPSDLVNARIGSSQSQEILTKQLQALGMRVVKSDVSTMLLHFNSNAIDVAYTSPLLVATMWSQYKRSVSHMSAFRIAPFFGAIIINRKSWDRVPDKFKPALLEAADRIAAEIAQEALKLENQAIETMKREGLSVPTLGPADQAAWDELFMGQRMEKLLADWYAPEWMSAVLGAVQKVKASAP
ncbi:MAG: TRAP transporter substrate-binding protein DctP [Spirochaetales bacterium]|nr:TRAP transporter substrate-binding protein DctP [Spirochaetales bacterium]